MNFETIIGYKNEKKELNRLVKMLRNIKDYRDKGLKLSKGLLLVGAPGVGKSAMARSMAGEGIALVELRAADCCGEEMSKSVHEAFETAKRNKPAILLLDELDKIAGTSLQFYMESNDDVKKILLQELDDLTDEDETLVVATCNDCGCLGEALTRTGRFDHTLMIDLPDQETRMKILDYYLKKIDLKHCYDIADLSRLTCGFSCSDLKCLANETGVEAVEKGRKSIRTEDVIYVMNRLNFRGSEKTGLEDEEAAYKIAVHEAGHALAAMVLCPEDVYGASILPQGDSLGHVCMMESRKKGTTIDDIKDEICIALAGRVAEREILGEISLGSENDLQAAAKRLLMVMTSHAAYGYRYMLCGMRAFPEIGAENLRESAANTFEAEMNDMDSRVTGMIQEHRELFDEIVRNLTARKALSKEQLAALMESFGKKEAA